MNSVADQDSVSHWQTDAWITQHMVWRQQAVWKENKIPETAQTTKVNSKWIKNLELY